MKTAIILGCLLGSIAYSEDSLLLSPTGIPMGYIRPMGDPYSEMPVQPMGRLNNYMLPSTNPMEGFAAGMQSGFQNNLQMQNLQNQMLEEQLNENARQEEEREEQMLQSERRFHEAMREAKHQQQLQEDDDLMTQVKKQLAKEATENRKKHRATDRTLRR